MKTQETVTGNLKTHTPTPSVEGIHGHSDVVDVIYRVPKGTQDRIVRAVNSHDTLLKAARHFLEKYRGVMHSEFDFPNDDWSFERDDDKISIEYEKYIVQAEKGE